MKNRTVTQYEYWVNIPYGANQYELDGEYDLSEDKIVEARYVKSYSSPGNPLVEALPKVWDDISAIRSYIVFPKPPIFEEVAEMNIRERRENIDSVFSDIRILLPFYPAIEEDFRSSIVSSYRRRKIQYSENDDCEVAFKGGQESSKVKTVPKHESEPSPGFTLLGQGGCGKSTGINGLLSRYPQVIIHNKGEINQFIQIVYLIVQCTPNSNFKQLYENIGRAIDKALGNFRPVYQEQFKKLRSLKDGYSLLQNLIEIFSIGCIILDEIELMDLQSTKETSFETLMTLSNATGVTFSVAGTLDAYEKLFFKPRTSRRLGRCIWAGEYCLDKKMFIEACFPITTFQWTEQKTNYEGELMDTLYECSHGVISDMVSIFKLVQKDQIAYIPSSRYSRSGKSQKGPAPKITPDYIRKLTDQYFRPLELAREKENRDLANLMKSRKIKEMLDLLGSEDRMTMQASYELFETVVSDGEFRQQFAQKQAVALILENAHPGELKTEKIYKAYDLVINSLKPDDPLMKNNEKIAALVLEKLNKAPRKKKSQQDQLKAEDIEALRQEYLED